MKRYGTRLTWYEYPTQLFLEQIGSSEVTALFSCRGCLMGGKRNPRVTYRGRRKALRDRVRSWGEPCALCGKAIDYSLPAKHPWSYELDEIRPVSRWREFGYPSPEACALDPNNVQPTHRICNQKKSNKTNWGGGSVTVRSFPTSKDWRNDNEE